MHSEPPLAYVCREDFIVDHCGGESVLHMGFLGETERPLDERLEFVSSPKSLHSRLRRIGTNVVGIDLNPEAVQFLRGHGLTDVYAGDVEALSESEIPNGVQFSVIVAGDIIEHLSNPGRMLEGVKRFLEPSGKMIVTTPNCYGLPNYMRFALGRFQEGGDHVQSYSQYTLRNLVRRHGWIDASWYTSYQERAEGIANRSFFTLGKLLLQRFPKFGGTLMLVCHLAGEPKVQPPGV